MRINIFYYPFGEVIEVRKMTELELSFAKVRITQERLGQMIIRGIKEL